jgi:inosine triphosphate pyrophosphatase
MSDVVFITGSQKKAEYLANYLGHPVDHIKVDLDEIQSLDLHEIVKKKVRQAYLQVQRPVLVEDVSLEFTGLGRLPGPFIKFFIEEIGYEGLCRIVDGKERSALARCVFGFYDGTEEAYFEGSLAGTIAETPAGEGGFGFDPIFIPEGFMVTRAQLNEVDDRTTYLTMKPFEKVRDFLEAREAKKDILT